MRPVRQLDCRGCTFSSRLGAFAKLPMKSQAAAEQGVATQSAVLRAHARAEESVLDSVLAALVSTVSGPAAFVCLAREGGCPCDLARDVDGLRHFDLVTKPLAQAFGLRCVPKGAALVLSPSDEGGDRAGAEYWRDYSLPAGLCRALVVSLYDGEALCGFAGVQRRAGDPQFSPSDAGALEVLVPLFIQATRARRRAEERSREIAALRAIGDVRGAVLVFDCERRRVVSICGPDKGAAWAPSSGGSLRSILKVLTCLVLAPGESEVKTPVRIGSAVILSVVPIAERDGGKPRYVAAHVAPVEPASDKLSPREREVANLLVEGYSNVNIAALCGLSPNTVRTFMRRLYAKLGVFNRADLVRQLVRRPLA